MAALTMAAAAAASFARLSVKAHAEPQAGNAESSSLKLGFSTSTALKGASVRVSNAFSSRRAASRLATPVCVADFPDDDEDEDFEEESPEEVAAAYEKLYGKAFGAVRNVRDFGEKKEDGDEGEDSSDSYRGRRGDEEGGRRGDSFDERVIQVRRVTKVVKGGKQLAFRAVVVVGDRNGKVGVGVGKAKEVIIAVQKAVTDAKRHTVNVPLTKYKTFPHRMNGRAGAATVMLRPAAVGTGVIAGGAVRVVLELAGLENALGKELGSGNPLNNARATLDAVTKMRQFKDVAKERGIAMEELWK